MKQAYFEFALWLIAAGAVFTTWKEIRRMNAPVTDAARSPAVETQLRPLRDRSALVDSISSSAQFIAEHDPFRVGHQPSSTAYGTAVVAQLPAASQTSPRLQGIVGAPGRLRIILSGIPGRDGNVVLQAGDSLDGYRVRRITMSSAVIAGRDTAWTLRLGNAWP